jgi:hypothetical protein
MRPTKGIILPGMGADARMYSHHAYERLVNIRFLNLPTYQVETVSATKLLPAGHLLAITHPNEVAAFIEEAIR